MHRTHYWERILKRQAGSLIWAMLGIVLLFGIVRGALIQSETVHAIDEDTSQILAGTLVREFRMRELDLDGAISRLNQAYHPYSHNRVLRFERWKSSELPASILTTESPEPSAAGASPPDPQATVPTNLLHHKARHSLNLEDIRFHEALRYVAALYGCVAGQKGEVIYLIPAPENRRTFGPLLQRTLRVQPTCWTRDLPPDSDLKPFLAEHGVQFYVGSEARRLPGGKVLIRNTQKQIELVEVILNTPIEANMIDRLRAWSTATTAGLRERLDL